MPAWALLSLVADGVGIWVEVRVEVGVGVVDMGKTALQPETNKAKMSITHIDRGEIIAMQTLA